MIKQLLAVLFVIILVLGFSLQAQAELFNRGTDTGGNRLIYDSDQNITWYDYTQYLNNWWNQVNWASTLTVNFEGTVIDDWRLPYTFSDCGGYNCTNSEMGYLNTVELGNWAGMGLANTGEFQHLIADSYWSETLAWRYIFSWSYQEYTGNERFVNYAIAVRSGDVASAVVPEPTSSILFLTGGATLIGRKFIRRKKIEV